jgi:hypothetical protein
MFQAADAAKDAVPLTLGRYTPKCIKPPSASEEGFIFYIN